MLLCKIHICDFAEGFCVMKFVIVNLITGLRIIIGLIMLFFPALSTEFYIFYLFAGFTDMIDGTIARILGAESQFGEKFDTFADSVFVASSLCKLLPVIDISTEIWIWIGIIAVIKVINIISGIVVQKRIVAVHSRVNKLTGFVLFALPFSFSFIDVMYSSAVVCLLATFAALHEGYLIRKRNFEGSKNAVS